MISTTAVCGACLNQESALERCVAAVDFDYPWPTLLYKLKGSEGPAWGQVLARLMANAWQASHSAPAKGVIWAPIPLHCARLSARGHNQSWSLLRGLVAHGVCRHGDRREADLLERLIPQGVQHRLGKGARQRNVQFAFNANSKHDDWMTQGAPKQVVLVDDVYTTGATLQAAARALKERWDVRVCALVFARTPSH